jgi:hypothetical protein
VVLEELGMGPQVAGYLFRTEIHIFDIRHR